MWKWFANKWYASGGALMLLAIGGLIGQFKTTITTCILLAFLVVGALLVLREYIRAKRDKGFLEKPWNMAMLDKCPIPSTDLPKVREVHKSRIAKGEGFTVREAKWVSRLATSIPTNIDDLSYKAWQYARTELMFEIIGRPFDSTVLDNLLMGLPAEMKTIFDFLSLLAEQREDRNKGIKDGVEQIRELVKVKSKKTKLEIKFVGTK